MKKVERGRGRGRGGIIDWSYFRLRLALGDPSNLLFFSCVVLQPQWNSSLNILTYHFAGIKLHNCWEILTVGCFVRGYLVYSQLCIIVAIFKVRLDMMARDFGVSKAFIDKELHALIAAGQLHCRIDAVRGVIEMNHPDTKNHLYRSVIRWGGINFYFSLIWSY